MEKLEHLDLPSYYESEDIDVNTQKQFCLCCLAENSKLIKITKCNHAMTFLAILKPELQLDKSAICFMCHSLIKKFHNFKLQVEKSLLKLDGQCYEFFPEHVSKPEVTSFTFSNIEINSTVDSKPVEFESNPFIPTAEVKPDSSTQNFSEVQLEVKIEHDSYSDAEIEPVATKKSKPTKKSRNSLESKYEGKIRVVTLSTDEMLEERNNEALKPGYLKLPFKCEKCITGFDHELTLKDHIEKRHTKKKGCFTCEICKSVLSTKTSFDEHNKRHFRRYECVSCYKRYNNIYSVLKHYNELHGKIDTHFACKMCDYTTESHRSYRYHLDKHRSAKVQCADCGSTFVNKTGLRVHMFTIHGASSRVYACGECGRRYRCKSGLAAHAAAHAAPAYCAPCRAHFRSPLGLRHHLRTHSAHATQADRKFACGECEGKFLSNSALQEHVAWVHRRHTNHVCDLCSKVFKNRSNLKKHKEFVHEKKRPPRNKICDHCGRGFTTASILQAHIRTHTGERPLRCARCPASFAHSAALYTHNKLLHAT